MPVCSIVKLLPLSPMDDLMHYRTRPSASCNSASGRPRHLRVIVLTILQTGMKKQYNIGRYAFLYKSNAIYQCVQEQFNIFKKENIVFKVPVFVLFCCYNHENFI